MQEENSSSKNISVLIVLAIILVGIVYFVMKSSQPYINAPKDENGREITKEVVQVSNVNLAAAKSNQEKLPEGFPSLIPVEYGEITNASKSKYVDKNATVYSIEYLSEKNLESKYNEYLSYMEKSGFEFYPDGQNNQTHYLYGQKNHNDLLVTISEQEEKTHVQISYLERSI